MNKRWRIQPHDARPHRPAGAAAGVPPIVAQLLLCRGVYEPEPSSTFLDAS